MRHRKTRVIFLCCHNSVTSQMAEAFLRKYGGNEFEVYSAGLQPREIDPLTIKVMEEVGIDLADHCSEPLRKYWGKMLYDCLVIMCKKADEECFLFPGVTDRVFWPFEDPGTNEMRRKQELKLSEEHVTASNSESREWLKQQEGASAAGP